MTDIDQEHRIILTDFGLDQFVNNKGGIGNECTHWVYAALLEARALDHDRALHIAQAGTPYTWGRRVGATEAMPGDIAQFHNFRNSSFVYLPDGSGGSRWMTSDKVRGPNHTGMVIITPKMVLPRAGAYVQLESHIHEPGTPVMTVRANIIFHESFAIALTAAELAAAKLSGLWPSTVDTSDFNAMLREIRWLDLRRTNEVSMTKAAAAIAQINHHKAPTIDGTEMAVVFRVQTTGHLRFYCPQQSAARLAMDAAAFAAEKEKVIKMMIRSGRPGESETKTHHLDEFGSDNKKQRIKDHRFDWSFTPTGIPLWVATFIVKSLAR